MALPRNPDVKKRYLLDPVRADSQTLIPLLFPPGSRHQILIRLNEYPYDLEPDLEHWVLWIRPSPQPDFELGPRLDYRLKRLVDEYFEPGTYLYFRNSPKHQSVGSIPHYHLIVQR